ncbi:unnamed protein product [Parnassius apollo]|uniref:(apollo) hypothetical protein n=1 Tax=Parnassius apollo TaxID=110799 RepID=A0A8S3XRY5_PARAO|nr:unnamed protein product [Parnassius apollo]
MVATMISNSVVTHYPTTSNEPPQPGCSKEISIWDDFDREVKNLQPRSSPMAKAITEIGAYLEHALLPRNSEDTSLEW